jgi:hypothetical protein
MAWAKLELDTLSTFISSSCWVNYCSSSTTYETSDYNDSDSDSRWSCWFGDATGFNFCFFTCLLVSLIFLILLANSVCFFIYLVPLFCLDSEYILVSDSFFVSDPYFLSLIMKSCLFNFGSDSKTWSWLAYFSFKSFFTYFNNRLLSDIDNDSEIDFN